MKKYVFLAAALTMSFALAGCSGKSDSAPSETDAAKATAKTDVSDQYVGALDEAANSEVNEIVSNLDPTFDGADELIDMDKVPGIDATTADDSNAKGETADAEVEITDAKIIDYSGNDILVVSFDFKNKSGREAAFAGQVKATAQQEGVDIAPAVVTGIEGISCETLTQIVKNGDRITVQKAFALTDRESPVTVRVTAANNPDPAETISKTFNLK